MDFLLTLYASLVWILPVLVVLTILVFLHELGHYTAARRNGVRVEVFSIGFGPEIFGWTDAHKTRWKFSLIPLGGYVKMFGDGDEASTPDHGKMRSLSPEEKKFTLDGKTIPQRMAVVAAGPIANILVTILCLWAVYMFTGEPKQEAIMGNVVHGGPAWEAGIRPGDRILKFGDIAISSFNQLKRAVHKRPSEHVQITYERKGEVFKHYVQPEDKGKYGVIGVQPERMPHTFWTSSIASIKATVRMSIKMLQTFWYFITGKEDSKQIGGLPSIAKMSKDAWSSGFFTLLTFMAILSLNLGIINLLPVPMLDGGHLLFYTIEAIRGKRVNEKAQDIAYKVGFALLISLMIYSHWNDFVRFNFWGYIQNFIAKLF